MTGTRCRSDSTQFCASAAGKKAPPQRASPTTPPCWSSAAPHVPESQHPAAGSVGTNVASSGPASPSLSINMHHRIAALPWQTNWIGCPFARRTFCINSALDYLASCTSTMTCPSYATRPPVFSHCPPEWYSYPGEFWSKATSKREVLTILEWDGRSHALLAAPTGNSDWPEGTLQVAQCDLEPRIRLRFQLSNIRFSHQMQHKGLRKAIKHKHTNESKQCKIHHRSTYCACKSADFRKARRKSHNSMDLARRNSTSCL